MSGHHRSEKFRPKDGLEKAMWNAVRKARLPFKQRRIFAHRIREDLLLRRRLEADTATFLDVYLIDWRLAMKAFREAIEMQMGA